jgi:hypothetical protein
MAIIFDDVRRALRGLRMAVAGVSHTEMDFSVASHPVREVLNGSCIAISRGLWMQLGRLWTRNSSDRADHQ